MKWKIQGILLPRASGLFFLPNLAVLVSHLSPLMPLLKEGTLKNIQSHRLGFSRMPSEFLKAVVRPRFPHLSYVPHSHPKMGNPKSVLLCSRIIHGTLCFYAFLFPLSAVQIYAFTISYCFPHPQPVASHNFQDLCSVNQRDFKTA